MSGMPPISTATASSVGKGSTAILPPPEYWAHLHRTMSGSQVERLKEQSDQRRTEFTPQDLGPPNATALDLLNRVADDGWLDHLERHKCPVCGRDLNQEERTAPDCPECRSIYNEHGGVTKEAVYVRHLAQTRSVDWVVAIHGMNTSGAWEEAFSWTFSTTWGRSVPVALYKYGIVIAGVMMIWRRHRLQRNLRTKLATLRDEAHTRGFDGNPDVIAHSFGTWLFGHLIRDELKRDPAERLRFGRVILVGCILRPDFDWKQVKSVGIIEDVLNHYGTVDNVVPWAHVSIWDSGPSGRRGFDGDEVLNIEALGAGHSDLLSMGHLPDCYLRYWRPFLLLPHAEAANLPNRKDPNSPWRPLPWPLRGTIFPLIALPLVAAAIAVVAAYIGECLWLWRRVFVNIAQYTAAGLAVLAGATLVWELSAWLIRGRRNR